MLRSIIGKRPAVKQEKEEDKQAKKPKTDTPESGYVIIEPLKSIDRLMGRKMGRKLCQRLFFAAFIVGIKSKWK